MSIHIINACLLVYFYRLLNIDCLMKEKPLFLFLSSIHFRSHFEIGVIQYACCRHFIQEREKYGNCAPKENVYRCRTNGIVCVYNIHIDRHHKNDKQTLEAPQNLTHWAWCSLSAFDIAHHHHRNYSTGTHARTPIEILCKLLRNSGPIWDAMAIVFSIVSFFVSSSFALQSISEEYRSITLFYHFSLFITIIIIIVPIIIVVFFMLCVRMHTFWEWLSMYRIAITEKCEMKSDCMFCCVVWHRWKWISSMEENLCE